MNEKGSEIEDQDKKLWSKRTTGKDGFLKVRHVQTAFLSGAIFLSYMIRVNMSIAIVDMTDTKQEKYFKWNLKIQSVILSSFFWGYLIMQVPAGALAITFGGKILILVSISVNSLASLLMPTVANIGGWHSVCVCRFVQGLTQALMLPSIHHLISQWIPTEEKSRTSGLIYGGGSLGIALQLLYSGFLAAQFGWQSIFYTNGAIGVIWVLTYAVFGSATPESNKFISKNELNFIQNSLGRVGEAKRNPTPWMKILSSVRVWALIVSHSGQNWGYNTMATEMPTYMAKVFKVNLKTNGVLSSLSYFSMFVVCLSAGFLADLIIKKRWLSLTNTRKFMNTLGFWGPACALIGLSYCPGGNTTVAVVLLSLTGGMNACIFSAFFVTHTDMAPKFSAILMGISNGFGTMFSIVAPIACGLLVNNDTDPNEWRKVFFSSAAILFSCNTFFLIYGTAEKQSWNEPQNEFEDNTTPPLLNSNIETQKISIT